jgi:hypothetical protein
MEDYGQRGYAGNSIRAAYTYAAVFGAGIAAVASDTLHVSCLNAINTPLSPIGAPSGTIFYVPVGAPPPVGIRGALYIV